MTFHLDKLDVHVVISIERDHLLHIGAALHASNFPAAFPVISRNCFAFLFISLSVGVGIGQTRTWLVRCFSVPFQSFFVCVNALIIS